MLKAIEDAQSRGKKPEEMKARRRASWCASLFPLNSAFQALIADKLHEHRLDVRAVRARARARD